MSLRTADEGVKANPRTTYFLFANTFSKWMLLHSCCCQEELYITAGTSSYPLDPSLYSKYTRALKTELANLITLSKITLLQITEVKREFSSPTPIPINGLHHADGSRTTTTTPTSEHSKTSPITISSHLATTGKPISTSPTPVSIEKIPIESTTSTTTPSTRKCSLRIWYIRREPVAK